MTQDPRRPSLIPRHPRAVTPGPRTRRMELWFALDVALIFVAVFVAVRLLDRDRPLPAAGLIGLAAALGALDAYRFVRLRHFRWLAMHGVITRGPMTLAQPRRLALRQRADELTALFIRPFSAGVEVRYEFEDAEGRPHQGKCLISRDAAPYYTVGDEIEIFYDPDHPANNTPSLVLRWYYRLGGASVVDEPEPEDELDFDAYWEEHPEELELEFEDEDGVPEKDA